MVPAFAPFLAAGQPAALQAVGVCLIDDAVEFGGEAAAKYVPQALAAFARGMQQTDDAVLRQSATYGIAQVPLATHRALLAPREKRQTLHPAPAPALPASQVARLFPQQLAPQLGALVPLLLATATHPEACEEEREGTTENAVFALGALATLPAYRDPALQAQWAAAGTQPAQVAALWLQRLPLKVGHDCQTGIRGDVLTSLSPCAASPLVLSQCTCRSTSRRRSWRTGSCATPWSAATRPCWARGWRGCRRSCASSQRCAAATCVPPPRLPAPPLMSTHDPR